MSIPEGIAKIKGGMVFLGRKDVYAIILIFIAGIGSFFLGMLYEREQNRPPVVITKDFQSNNENVAVSTTTTSISQPTNTISIPITTIQPAKNTPTATVVTSGVYVGSKNSNKFHLPTCPGAKTISLANQIWFQTKEEATAKGYIPASNCKGI